MASEFSLAWDNPDLAGLKIVRWEASSHFMIETDGWMAEVYKPDDCHPSDYMLQDVTLTLGSQQIMLARSEHVGTGTPGRMALHGRDYLVDIVEGDIDPGVTVHDGDTLSGALLRALTPYGIQSIVSDGGFATRQARTGKALGRKKTAIDPGELKLSDLKAEPGRKVAHWCSHLLSRHGLVLQPSVSRDAIVATQPDYTQSASGKLRRKKGPIDGKSVVLGSYADRDASKVFTYLLLTGMGGKETEKRAALRKEWQVSTAASMWSGELALTLGQVAEPGRRAPGAGPLDKGKFYRFCYHHDQMARSQLMLDKGAVRIAADSLRDTLRYTATVRGFTDPDTKTPYAPDTMLEVDDEENDVHETLWVAGRRFVESKGTGQLTELELWRPGSFQIS